MALIIPFIHFFIKNEKIVLSCIAEYYKFQFFCLKNSHRHHFESAQNFKSLTIWSTNPPILWAHFPRAILRITFARTLTQFSIHLGPYYWQTFLLALLSITHYFINSLFIGITHYFINSLRARAYFGLFYFVSTITSLRKNVGSGKILARPVKIRSSLRIRPNFDRPV
jgi:hypothetical protein